MVEDQDSTNFTFVNRQRLAARTPTPLNDNDELRLGRVLLRFKTT
jgi:pSer/pThr/pTyr-binding forkhead associated (FHA) protein